MILTNEELKGLFNGTSTDGTFGTAPFLRFLRQSLGARITVDNMSRVAVKESAVTWTLAYGADVIHS